MSRGHGSIQTEILERLRLLRYESLPALWHPLVMAPVVNGEIVMADDRTLRVRRLRLRPPEPGDAVFKHDTFYGGRADERQRVLILGGQDKLRLVHDEATRVRRQVASRADHNRLWWEFEVGRTRPSAGDSLPLGMLFSKDSRSRRESVYRALRKLDETGHVEVTPVDRSYYVRLPVTSAEERTTEARLWALRKAVIRRQVIDRHFNSYGYSVSMAKWISIDPKRTCVDGRLCSHERHLNLFAEYEHFGDVIEKYGLPYPRLWRLFETPVAMRPSRANP